jgi:hypothetical protein
MVEINKKCDINYDLKELNLPFVASGREILLIV